MPYPSDSQNGGFPFYLSPQQQQVLLQALASDQSGQSGQNKEGPRGPPSNGGFSMSPASIKASPDQRNSMFSDIPGSSYLDGYDVDYVGDSSFGDLDVSNISNTIPDDGNASANSETPENDGPEKRAREDEEDGGVSPSNDAKRRENGEKIPKKPGRKPLTSEPTSKRKAQNRAAQRAFRERKEKHLKDLETKVVELEKKSADATSQNNTLRKQLDSVTAELNEYKRKVRLLNPSRSLSGSQPKLGTGNQGLQNLNSIDFQFEFPRFGYLPGPPQNNNNNNNKQSGQQSSSSSSNLSKNPPSQNDQSQGTRNSGSKSNSDVNRSPQSQYDVFSGLPVSRTSLDSGAYSLGSVTTGSPSGSSQSNLGPSSSCGTSPEPNNQSPMGFKPVDTMTTIGEEQPAVSMGNNGQAGHFADVSTDFNFDWLAQQNGGQFDPQLFGDYREPQNNILNFEDSFFSDALDTDFLTPYNLPSTEQTPAAKNLIAQINEQQEAVEPPVKSEPREQENIDCFDVWSKIQSCDKVQTGGFDLDSLCSELQTKAKCGGDDRGPVIQEEEFQTTLRKYLGDEFMTMCGTHVVSEYAREGRQSQGSMPKGQQKV